MKKDHPFTNIEKKPKWNKKQKRQLTHIENNFPIVNSLLHSIHYLTDRLMISVLLSTLPHSHRGIIARSEDDVKNILPLCNKPGLNKKDILHQAVSLIRAQPTRDIAVVVQQDKYHVGYAADFKNHHEFPYIQNILRTPAYRAYVEAEKLQYITQSLYNNPTDHPAIVNLMIEPDVVLYILKLASIGKHPNIINEFSQENPLLKDFLKPLVAINHYLDVAVDYRKPSDPYDLIYQARASKAAPNVEDIIHWKPRKANHVDIQQALDDHPTSPAVVDLALQDVLDELKQLP